MKRILILLAALGISRANTEDALPKALILGDSISNGSWRAIDPGAKSKDEWSVREQAWKMNESGELFDMSDAPFAEKPVAAAADTEPSKAARERLTKVLAELNPAAGGKKGGKKNKAERKQKKAATGA